jgi:hypothetical protein
MSGEWFQNTEELRFYIRAMMNPYEYQIHDRRAVLVRWLHGSTDDPMAFLNANDLCPFCGYTCPASEGYNIETTCYNHSRKYVEILHPDGTRINVEDGVIIKHRVKEFGTEDEVQEHIRYTRYVESFRELLPRKDWVRGELYSRGRRHEPVFN